MKKLIALSLLAISLCSTSHSQITFEVKNVVVTYTNTSVSTAMVTPEQLNALIGQLENAGISATRPIRAENLEDLRVHKVVKTAYVPVTNYTTLFTTNYVPPAVPAWPYEAAITTNVVPRITSTRVVSTNFSITIQLE